MLSILRIQNYAIIDDLEVTFSSSLNIITGETGAGKSIIMGALSLILGERADTSVLLNKEKKCVVEGIFKITDNVATQQWLQEQDIETDVELIIRREINTSNKSRAFINDTPVSVQQLQQLGFMLIDLHQQFDTLQLGKPNFQRTVLDALANNNMLLKTYTTTFKHWQEARHELYTLQQQKAQFQATFDYNQFLYTELEEANFKPNELEEIEQELKLLSNAEAIKSTLDRVQQSLQEGDQPLVQQLKILAQQLNTYVDFHQQIPALHDRLRSTYVELQDIASELERLNTNIQLDANQLQYINDRLALGYKLLKKHNVNTTNDLLTLQQSLAQKLQAVLHIDEQIQQTEKQAQALHTEATSQAQQLFDKRKKAITPFTKTVNQLLQKIGMPNAQLQVDIRQDELHVYGNDQIEFLFDANRSGHFELLHKVASGGELSRLMLSIKSLVAQSIDLPTLIFDEIDTGISGEAAKQVGCIMKDLATSRQIICITHQPQIAARAYAHYFIYKTTVDKKIQTCIKTLNKKERIETIARMLSGENLSTTSLQIAEEMIEASGSSNSPKGKGIKQYN